MCIRDRLQTDHTAILLCLLVHLFPLHDAVFDRDTTQENIFGDRQLQMDADLLIDHLDPGGGGVRRGGEFLRNAVHKDLALIAAVMVRARQDLHQR